MTFFQLIKEIFDNSRERIKTPITGAFFTAFILWNWRPILSLMFSKIAIEDRITIVDTDFINFWSWLAPLLLAIGYITVVPLFTNLIDGWMVKNKESRIDKIYETKDYDLDKRIDIAKKELKLTNVESDNKELEVLQQQIKSLEDRNEQNVRSHTNAMNNSNVAIAELNSQLEGLGKDYAELLKNSSSTNFKSFVHSEENQLYTLQDSDIEGLGYVFIKALVDISNNIVNIHNVPQDVLNVLVKNKFIAIKRGKYVLSDLGQHAVRIIKNKNLLIK